MDAPKRVEVNAHCQGVPRRTSVRAGSAMEFGGCGREATLGLFGALTADDGGGVLFVIGTCREHVRETRRYLARYSPDPIDTWSLDVIRARWGMFVDEGVQTISDVA